MTRKLVTIRKVLDIKPIIGADNIETAIIGGWTCVVKKGQFNIGDLCLYFEIDSFLPEKPEFEFLRSSSYKIMYDGTTGFRLRTIRLRKQLSQGLLLPLTTFPEIDFSDTKKDYAEDLGVRLWEQPISENMKSFAIGNYPTHIIPKSDQERIQNLSNELEDYKRENLLFEITEKLDGSSVTYFYNEGYFGICSRNLEVQEIENSGYNNINKEYCIKEKLEKLNKNLALQGEMVGPGIQKNPLKILKLKWFVFDIYDIDNKRFMTSEERTKLLNYLDLPSVPMLVDCYSVKEETVESLLEKAKGNSYFGNFKREGLVFKSTTLFNGQIISFKAINNDYLLSECN